MNVLVTGGSGFLGLALCRALVLQGHQVSSFQRHFSAELKHLGVRQVLGALNDKDKLLEALRDQQAVLHNAAKASGWGAWDDFYQTNVVGTQCLIAGCLELGIRKLVYTSTPSVVHDGHRPVAGGNEANTPYARRYTAHYPHTKMLAERAVLDANSDALATVALRPRLIWGPGDTQLLPRLAARACASSAMAATSWIAPTLTMSCWRMCWPCAALNPARPAPVRPISFPTANPSRSATSSTACSARRTRLW